MKMSMRKRLPLNFSPAPKYQQGAESEKEPAVKCRSAYDKKKLKLMRPLSGHLRTKTGLIQQKLFVSRGHPHSKQNCCPAQSQRASSEV